MAPQLQSTPQTLVQAREMAYSSVPGASLNRSIRAAGPVGRARITSETTVMMQRLRAMNTNADRLLSSAALSLPYETRLLLVKQESLHILQQLQVLQDKVVGIANLEALGPQVQQAQGGKLKSLQPEVGLVWFAWGAIAATVTIISVVYLTNDVWSQLAAARGTVENNNHAMDLFVRCLEGGKPKADCEPLLKVVREVKSGSSGISFGTLLFLAAAGYGGWWWYKNKGPGRSAA